MRFPAIMLGVLLCTIKVEIKRRRREAKILERVKCTAIRQPWKPPNKKTFKLSASPWYTALSHLKRLWTKEKVKQKKQNTSRYGCIKGMYLRILWPKRIFFFFSRLRKVFWYPSQSVCRSRPPTRPLYSILASHWLSTIPDIASSYRPFLRYQWVSCEGGV